MGCTDTLAIIFHALLLLPTSDGMGVRRGFNYIFYTNPMNWNDALSICEASGTTLFTPASLQKYTDFKQIFDLWSSSGETTLELWMGLYDMNPPTMNFTWSDCCVAGPWSSWATGEPNMGDTEHCVRLYDGKTWKTRSCGIQFPFICESENAGCEFKTLANFGLDISNDVEDLGPLTWEECQTYCMYLHTDTGEDCIAFTHTSNGSCLIERGSQVYVTTLPYSNTTSSSTTAVKRCYNYSINRTIVAAANTNSTPRHSCDVHLACEDPLFLPYQTPTTTIQPSTAYQTMSSTFIIQGSGRISVSPSVTHSSDTVITPSLTSTETTQSTIYHPDTTQATGYHLDTDMTITLDTPSTTVTTPSISVTVAIPLVTSLFSSSDQLYPSDSTNNLATPTPISMLVDTMTETLSTIDSFQGEDSVSDEQKTFSTTSSYASIMETSYSYVTSASASTTTKAPGPNNTTGWRNTTSGPGLCPCFCFTKDNISDLYKLYFANLRLNKKQLSSFRRSHSSAEDARMSARAMGSVLGVGILVAVGLLLVIPDINVIVKLFSRPKYR